MPGNITPVSFIKKKKKNSYITCKLLYLRQAFLLSCPAVAEYSVFYYHLIKKIYLKFFCLSTFSLYSFSQMFLPLDALHIIFMQIFSSPSCWGNLKSVCINFLVVQSIKNRRDVENHYQKRRKRQCKFFYVASFSINLNHGESLMYLKD